VLSDWVPFLVRLPSLICPHAPPSPIDFDNHLVTQSDLYEQIASTLILILNFGSFNSLTELSGWSLSSCSSNDTDPQNN
jgi:hypothetical protein